jgi:hypothetical protein
VTLVLGLASRADVVVVGRGTTDSRDGWLDAVDDQPVLSVPAREHVPRRGEAIVQEIIIAQARFAVEEIGWHRWTRRHRSPRRPVRENVTAMS